MKPNIGRIVHYKSFHQASAVAALIVGVGSDNAVNLQLFYEDGEISFLQNADQGDQIGQWNWPPRV